MQEIIRLNPECIPCVIGNQLDRYPEHIDNNTKIEYMQRVLGAIANASKGMSAPIIVREINNIQREMFGTEMDYSEIKSHFNKLMLEKEAQVQEKIDAADDALKLAVKYAIIGNYIDFGAMKSVDEEKLEDFLGEAEGVTFSEEEYQEFKQEVEQAKHIAYLTDNCGEIVMDKLLVKEILKRNPEAKLTVIVRGKPVVNDATLDDAIQVGMDKIVKVMGNGSDVAGTCFEELSDNAKATMDAADVIIAKGQGNFETMQMCGMNVFYIFMCKCEMFARKFQVPRFTGMLLSDKNC